ncbi:MAG: photosystem I reaction center subunit PsaK [Synechococcaceae cyanobacterium SM2_3_60]|nr:photosystem I reaction center subunit PsaK [Synechococcaceae cyanobacterium SM2_3_60]
MMLATVPTTPIWSANVAIVMILANVGAVLLWKSAISLINAWLGAIGYEARAVLSVPSDAAIFTLPVVNITLPELLAATSFGHLIGAGIILGLGRLGAL